MTYSDHPDPRVAKAIRKAQRPWYQKKRFLIPLVLVAFVFVVSVLAGRDSDPVAPSAPAVDAAGAPVAPPPADTTGGMIDVRFGEAADADGMQVTATAPKSTSDGFGNSYWCTTVTYANNTGDQQHFNTFDWKLVGTDGVEVDPTYAGSKNILGSGEFRPGGKKSGDVCFNKTGYGSVTTPGAVVYRGGLFGTPVQWQR